jgi:hypothetical protein
MQQQQIFSGVGHLPTSITLLTAADDIFNVNQYQHHHPTQQQQQWMDNAIAAPTSQFTEDEYYRLCMALPADCMPTTTNSSGGAADVDASAVVGDGPICFCGRQCLPNQFINRDIEFINRQHQQQRRRKQKAADVADADGFVDAGSIGLRRRKKNKSATDADEIVDDDDNDDAAANDKQVVNICYHFQCSKECSELQKAIPQIRDRQFSLCSTCKIAPAFAFTRIDEETGRHRVVGLHAKCQPCYRGVVAVTADAVADLSMVEPTPAKTPAHHSSRFRRRDGVVADTSDTKPLPPRPLLPKQPKKTLWSDVVVDGSSSGGENGPSPRTLAQFLNVGGGGGGTTSNSKPDAADVPAAAAAAVVNNVTTPTRFSNAAARFTTVMAVSVVGGSIAETKTKMQQLLKKQKQQQQQKMPAAHC